MPETPLHSRRKKFAVEDAMLAQNRNNPAFSSKYAGLEKEVEPTNKENGNLAEIHEGKVRNYVETINPELPYRICLTIAYFAGCGSDVACQISTYGSPWCRLHFNVPSMPQ
jgi:hypothetical protein